METPVKTPQSNRSKTSILSKSSENENPNNVLSPGLKLSKLRKSGAKKQNPDGNSPLVKNRIRERKFVVAKKSKNPNPNGLNQSVKMGCSKCSKGNGKLMKCLCVAYESLRASQEEFFKNRGDDLEKVCGLDLGGDCGDKNLGLSEKFELGDGFEAKVEQNGNVEPGIKRSWEKMGVEEEGECVPEPGSGKVMQLVNAFEKMKVVGVAKLNECEEGGEKEGENKGVRWGLPGLERELSSSSFCPSELFLTSECLGLDSRRSSSLDSNRGRNSSESFGAIARRKWRRRKQLKTTAKPFKLRTEERGKCKEEEFMKKVQQQMEEEERLRVPIAQGLPWTTDEPECLAKPPLKEATRPIDLVLHSDVRAEERAEFDHQVAEKMSLIEQYRMERDRQQKLAEEEEIRRLRKELVPKAQPMPYFDRPFIPRRSEKQPTIPKEPKFHFPQHKKSKCMQQSWSDTSSYISSSDACYGL